jgi:23S rRNA pseudouridine2605 synthase
MTDSPAGDKLHKLLAQAGCGSRREMERVIAAGRVSVNGKAATLGDRATVSDLIKLDGKPVKLGAAPGSESIVLIYNKPEGEICSRSDPEGRRTVFESLPKLPAGRWISVGRLDYNTSGLLLFTTDGVLANKLMHPSSVIEREYLCRVLGNVDEPMIKRMTEGVLLDDGVARFSDVVEGGGEGANRWFYVVVMEGRNREVRRLWESQDVQVSRLKRVRYGKVFLPSKLRQGQWAEMPIKEVDTLYKSLDLESPKVGSLPPKVREKAERQQRKNKPSSRNSRS